MFDAGSIHASLVLDRSPFAAGLATAQTDAAAGSQKLGNLMKAGLVAGAVGVGLAVAGIAKVGIEELANAQKIGAHRTAGAVRSAGCI